MNTRVLILDAALRAVAPGEAGELCLAGELVGADIRNNPEMTASRFVHHTAADGTSTRIYRTGDQAKLLPNGEIAFLGRLDDQVKFRGYRVELGEIVSTLDRYPSIEANVVVVRETSAGPALVAYLVSGRGVNVLEKDLRFSCAAPARLHGAGTVCDDRCTATDRQWKA